MFTNNGGRNRVAGSHCHADSQYRGAGSPGAAADDRTGHGWHTGPEVDSRGGTGRRNGAVGAGSPPSADGGVVTGSACGRHNSRDGDYGHGSYRGSQGHLGAGCSHEAVVGHGDRSHHAVGTADAVSGTGHDRDAGNLCGTVECERMKH